MVTETLSPKKRQSKNGLKPKSSLSFPTNNWPSDIQAAYHRGPGPYTIHNVSTLIAEETVELFNGWLVWQPMTNAEERRIAASLQEILSLAARARGFGQAYPDQFECVMTNGDVYKPDVCVISQARYDTKIEAVKPGDGHLVLRGSPELEIELRSPSNRRTQERKKRKGYFESGALVIWDVDPKKHIIWVYEAENPEKGMEYVEEDEISCSLLSGWKRRAGDFFARGLSAEEIVGEAAAKWREESRSIGELETLRAVLIRQARRKFRETNLPPDLETRLNSYNVTQLTELTDTITISPTLAEWLANLPA